MYFFSLRTTAQDHCARASVVYFYPSWHLFFERQDSHKDPGYTITFQMFHSHNMNYSSRKISQVDFGTLETFADQKLIFLRII